MMSNLLSHKEDVVVSDVTAIWRTNEEPDIQMTYDDVAVVAIKYWFNNPFLTLNDSAAFVICSKKGAVIAEWKGFPNSIVVRDDNGSIIFSHVPYDKENIALGKGFFISSHNGRVWDTNAPEDDVRSICGYLSVPLAGNYVGVTLDTRPNGGFILAVREGRFAHAVVVGVCNSSAYITFNIDCHLWPFGTDVDISDSEFLPDDEENHSLTATSIGLSSRYALPAACRSAPIRRRLTMNSSAIRSGSNSAAPRCPDHRHSLRRCESPIEVSEHSCLSWNESSRESGVNSGDDDKWEQQPPAEKDHHSCGNLPWELLTRSTSGTEKDQMWDSEVSRRFDSWTVQKAPVLTSVDRPQLNLLPPSDLRTGTADHSWEPRETAFRLSDNFVTKNPLTTRFDWRYLPPTRRTIGPVTIGLDSPPLMDAATDGYRFNESNEHDIAALSNPSTTISNVIASENDNCDCCDHAILGVEPDSSSNQALMSPKAIADEISTSRHRRNVDSPINLRSFAESSEALRVVAVAVGVKQPAETSYTCRKRADDKSKNLKIRSGDSQNFPHRRHHRLSSSPSTCGLGLVNRFERSAIPVQDLGSRLTRSSCLSEEAATEACGADASRNCIHKNSRRRKKTESNAAEQSLPTVKNMDLSLVASSTVRKTKTRKKTIQHRTPDIPGLSCGDYLVPKDPIHIAADLPVPERPATVQRSVQTSPFSFKCQHFNNRTATPHSGVGITASSLQSPSNSNTKETPGAAAAGPVGRYAFMSRRTIMHAAVRTLHGRTPSRSGPSPTVRVCFPEQGLLALKSDTISTAMLPDCILTRSVPTITHSVPTRQTVPQPMRSDDMMSASITSVPKAASNNGYVVSQRQLSNSPNCTLKISNFKWSSLSYTSQKPSSRITAVPRTVPCFDTPRHIALPSHLSTPACATAGPAKNLFVNNFQVVSCDSRTAVNQQQIALRSSLSFEEGSNKFSHIDKLPSVLSQSSSRHLTQNKTAGVSVLGLQSSARRPEAISRRSFFSRGIRSVIGESREPEDNIPDSSRQRAASATKYLKLNPFPPRHTLPSNTMMSLAPASPGFSNVLGSDMLHARESGGTTLLDNHRCRGMHVLHTRSYAQHNKDKIDTMEGSRNRHHNNDDDDDDCASLRLSSDSSLYSASQESRPDRSCGTAATLAALSLFFAGKHDDRPVERVCRPEIPCSSSSSWCGRLNVGILETVQGTIDAAFYTTRKTRSKRRQGRASQHKKS